MKSLFKYPIAICCNEKVCIYSKVDLDARVGELRKIGIIRQIVDSQCSLGHDFDFRSSGL